MFTMMRGVEDISKYSSRSHLVVLAVVVCSALPLIVRFAQAQGVSEAPRPVMERSLRQFLQSFTDDKSDILPPSAIL